MPWRGSGLGSERDRHIRNICQISPASRWIKMPVVEMRMQGIGLVREEMGLFLDMLPLRCVSIIQVKMTSYLPLCFTDPPADTKLWPHLQCLSGAASYEHVLSRNFLLDV